MQYAGETKVFVHYIMTTYWAIKHYMARAHNKYWTHACRILILEQYIKQSQIGRDWRWQQSIQCCILNSHSQPLKYEHSLTLILNRKKKSTI